MPSDLLKRVRNLLNAFDENENADTFKRGLKEILTRNASKRGRIRLIISAYFYRRPNNETKISALIQEVDSKLLE